MTGLDAGRVVELEPIIDHSRCHTHCTPAVKCPNTGAPTFVRSTRGRWDTEAGRTALPYEPVYVVLNCGCTFGDETLAEPVTRSGETP